MTSNKTQNRIQRAVSPPHFSKFWKQDPKQAQISKNRIREPPPILACTKLISQLPGRSEYYSQLRVPSSRGVVKSSFISTHPSERPSSPVLRVVTCAVTGPFSPGVQGPIVVWERTTMFQTPGLADPENLRTVLPVPIPRNTGGFHSMQTNLLGFEPWTRPVSNRRGFEPELTSYLFSLRGH